MIGITPEQFWEMTPAEVNAVMEGYKDKRLDMARLVAHIINYTGRLKKPISGEDLLGIEKSGYGRKLTKKELMREKEWLRRLKEKDKKRDNG